MRDVTIVTSSDTNTVVSFGPTPRPVRMDSYPILAKTAACSAVSVDVIVRSRMVVGLDAWMGPHLAGLGLSGAT